MTDAAEHLEYAADHMGEVGALASFVGRMSVSRAGEDVLVGLGDRSLRIRAAANGLLVGSDVVSLGSDPEATLARLAPILARRLGQIGG